VGVHGARSANLWELHSREVNRSYDTANQSRRLDSAAMIERSGHAFELRFGWPTSLGNIFGTPTGHLLDRQPRTTDYTSLNSYRIPVPMLR
jgi:hypothetical protein